MNARDDERIVARIEAAANEMPDAPVSWDRVRSLARRKALISAAVALLAALVAAALLTFGGSAGSYGIHGVAPIAIPFAGVSVPDVRGMSEAAALSKLKSVGLDGAADARCRTRRPACVVGGSQPAAGSNVVSGAQVKLALLGVRAGRPRSHEPPSPTPTAKATGKRKHKIKTILTPIPIPTPSPAKPVKIVLAVFQPTIEADGKSTTTIEASVLDAKGNRLKHQVIVFTASDPADTITTRSIAGTATIATVTSSKMSGRVMIFARDGTLLEHTFFTQAPVAEPKPSSNCGGEGGPGNAGEPTETKSQSSPPCPPEEPKTEPATTPTSPPTTPEPKSTAPG